jgi:hypothetical protein
MMSLLISVARLSHIQPTRGGMHTLLRPIQKQSVYVHRNSICQAHTQHAGNEANDRKYLLLCSAVCMHLV